ncbi:MAG: porin family protein [Gemmatimonadota bacterium]
MDEDPDQGEETDRLTSLGGGGFIRFGVAGLSLQLEVLALTKGAQSEADPALDGEVKLKMDYIEVPLTAMFALGSGPYVFVGPAVAFEIGCEVEAEFEGGEFSGDCDDTAPGEDAFERKKMDVGLTGGIGFHIPAGPGSILVEGRYTPGLTNINDAPNDDTKIRHRSFAAFAGYAIPIGGR